VVEEELARSWSSTPAELDQAAGYVHKSCFARRMSDDAKSADEIADLIKGQATLSLGPWPRDLLLTIFGRGSRWSCGLSPALQTSDIAYRDGVLQIARQLQKTVPYKRL
jgi:hypothetical protein